MKEQLYITGTEPPPDPIRTPEMDIRIHSWLEAKDEARRMTEKRKDQEHLLLVACVERGLDRYPYVDPVSGKTRYFVPDRTPKAKTVAAPAPKKIKTKHTNVSITAGGVTVELGSVDEAADKLKDIGERRAKKQQADSERVESRRVPRSTVEVDVDPFGKTRASMETEH